MDGIAGAEGGSYQQVQSLYEILQRQAFFARLLFPVALPQGTCIDGCMPRGVGKEFFGFCHRVFAVASDEGGFDQVMHGADQRRLVGQRRDQCCITGVAHRDATGNQARGGNQQARAGHFGQSTVLQRTQSLPERDQCMRSGMIDRAFMPDDVGFAFGRGEVEVQRDEALASTGLLVLEHALVAGVVRHDEAESGGGVQGHAETLDR